ncbi:MAG: ATP-dependent protease LonB [Firmicutes bacterium]|nr:ATP-dependent protease LonB [Bacillota bacterium]
MLVLAGVQVVFAAVIAIYFLTLLKSAHGTRSLVDRESERELKRLEKMRAVQLSEPLAERTRPATLADIVGQEDGLRALRAALCGEHPQHVLIYGPPGVGKTAAARVVLEEAKRSSRSPFGQDARFFELDATTARFDERGIADPLIGSVHDPIYQGAGSMGIAGIPQPREGAVTKAHGGILFIDEIGELHPIQFNKLLKVLEDRRVYFESAYYNQDNEQLPKHIHDIFQNGLPADFRLVGATTRSPDELPPALRSRCLEIFFRGLTAADVAVIARRAAERLDMPVASDAIEVITKHANSGRDAVNMLQFAASIATTEGRRTIRAADLEWVAHSGRMTPRPEQRVPAACAVGVVCGLAVTGPATGMLLQVEATAAPAVRRRAGRITVTGVVDEEELGGGGRVVRRQSMARSSVETVLTALRLGAHVCADDYDIHINFPGGIPVDGPSAGLAMALAIYSAVHSLPVDPGTAVTGEVSVTGAVRPVGGVPEKIEAAAAAGARRALIPVGNDQEFLHRNGGVEVVAVATLADALELVWPDRVQTREMAAQPPSSVAVFSRAAALSADKQATEPA